MGGAGFAWFNLHNRGAMLRKMLIMYVAAVAFVMVAIAVWGWQTWYLMIPFIPYAMIIAGLLVAATKIKLWE